MRSTFLPALASVLAALVLFCGNASAQVSVALSPIPMQRFVDNNGNACSGCKLFTYAAGTVTKLASYTSSTGTAPNLNPVILNSRGEAQVWLTGAPYKIVLSPATDSDPPTNAFWTVDNILTNAGIFPSIPTTRGYVPVWNNITGTLLADGAPTGQFYSNFGPNLVDRMGDRVIIGKQSNLYDGTSAGCVTSCTWISDPANYTGIFRYLEEQAQLYDVVQNGFIAATFASQSSDAGGNCCSIGVASYTRNNFVGAAATWNFYSTTIRGAGAGTTLAWESDIGNIGATVNLNSYNINPGGQTVNVWAACGGELFTASQAINPCSAAMTTVPNGAAYLKGIVALNGSISTLGDTNYAKHIFIEMPIDYQVKWVYDGSDQYGAFITSHNTGQGVGIDFVNSGVQFQNTSGNPLGQFDWVATARNYVAFHPGVGVGTPGTIYAAGLDPDLDVEIDPKGVGSLKLGYASTAAAVAGNFSATRTLVLKDVNGLVLLVPAATVAW